MGPKYRRDFEYIRGLLNSGEIDYETAKKLAEPKLKEMNEKGLAIAKKHGKRFRPFTFSGLMR